MIARRYAMALLALSVKEGNEELIKKELGSLSELMKQKKYFRFFSDRMITPGKKLDAASSLSPLMRAFLRLVIENKREEELCLISKEYSWLLDQRNNVMNAEVFSKLPLTPDQRSKIKGKLEKSTGKKMNVSYSADKCIIGGVRIKYGSKVIDGTVSGMLEGYLDQLIRR